MDDSSILPSLSKVFGSGPIERWDSFAESLHPVQLVSFFEIMLHARGPTAEVLSFVCRHNRRICPTCSGYAPGPLDESLVRLRELYRYDGGAPLRCPEGHPVFIAPADA